MGGIGIRMISPRGEPDTMGMCSSTIYGCGFRDVQSKAPRYETMFHHQRVISSSSSSSSTYRCHASSEDVVRGLAFSCTECGACCTGSGHVWLNRAEVSAIAHLLGDIDEDVFIDTYCKVSSRKDGWWMLKNAADSDACIFLDQETNHCMVYGARPLQCATYPWWPELVQSRKAWAQEAQHVCEGILLDDHHHADTGDFVSTREAAAHLDAFCAYLAASPTSSSSTTDDDDDDYDDDDDDNM